MKNPFLAWVHFRLFGVEISMTVSVLILAIAIIVNLTYWLGRVIRR